MDIPLTSSLSFCFGVVWYDHMRECVGYVFLYTGTVRTSVCVKKSNAGPVTGRGGL
jgi:hypothetical protein